MKIVQVGSGGVGFWAALALSASERVIVFDDDTLDGTGGERLPDVRLFGRRFNKKVDLLQFLARNVDVRDCKFSEQESNIIEAGDLLLDTSDLSTDERKQFVAIANGRGARYVRASYDLTAASFIVVVAAGVGFSRNPAHGGYTMPPALHHAMVAGGFVADVITRLLREGVTLPKRLEVKYDQEEARRR